MGKKYLFLIILLTLIWLIIAGTLTFITSLNFSPIGVPIVTPQDDDIPGVDVTPSGFELAVACGQNSVGADRLGNPGESDGCYTCVDQWSSMGCVDDNSFACKLARLTTPHYEWVSCTGCCRHM